MDFPQQPHSKCTLTLSDDLDDEEEEDFQTVSLEDDHWTTKGLLLAVHGKICICGPHTIVPFILAVSFSPSL